MEGCGEWLDCEQEVGIKQSQASRQGKLCMVQNISASNTIFV